MTDRKDKFEQVEVRSREELRRWLLKHASQERSIWLVTWKVARPDRHLTYDDIVEEALAHGWVDSQPRALDAERSMRRLSPRKPGSSWSRLNKQRVEKLSKAGKMASSGIDKVEAAKRDGSWSRLDDVEVLSVPKDLSQALRKEENAVENFDAFPRSSKRAILEWIGAAKRPQTRNDRITKTVEAAGRNERINAWRRRKSN